ncbi:MAG: hypothetical protein KGL94_08495, partial [Acidobacteriota bacterium]|nr:hypothetical protein [Acidobacteriota bacterium]
MTVRERAGISIEALAALARGVADGATRTSAAQALQDVADAARAATGAEVAVLRIPAGDALEAVAVAGSAALAAELEGDRVPPDAADGRVAERINADALLRLEAGAATLELYRTGAFSASEELAADLAAGLASLVIRAFAPAPPDAAGTPPLELAGEALAAALHETAPAAEVV